MRKWQRKGRGRGKAHNQEQHLDVLKMVRVSMTSASYNSTDISKGNGPFLHFPDPLLDLYVVKLVREGVEEEEGTLRLGGIAKGGRIVRGGGG